MHLLRWPFLLCGACLVLAGCPATTLEPWQLPFACHSTLECDADHVCVDARCVPRGQAPVVDGAVVVPDSGRDGAVAPDGQPSDATVDADGASDAALTDRGPAPDAVAWDGIAAPDTAVASDAVLDTGAAPDTAAADSTAPDSAVTDSAAPDAATPDAATPDTAAPDTSAPDTAAPDTAAPDTAAPDTAAPDTTAVDTGPPCVDEDSDQHGENCAAGPDCNDNDRENWDALTAWVDADADGFTVGGSVVLCTDGSLPGGYAAAASVEEDCDDDPGSGCGDGCFPSNGAADVCDGYDQDCDTELDEDPELVWYHDADGDGFTRTSDVQAACEDPDDAGTEWVDTATADDCDDDPGACGADCTPEGDERWLDGTCDDTWNNDCQQGADSADPGCARVVPSNIPLDRVCANAIDLELPAARNLNTDNGSIGGSAVGASVFSVVTQGNGAPDIAVFAYRNINLAYPLTVNGTRALALVACGDVTISAPIDACASNVVGGPGGYSGGAYQVAGAGYGSSEGGGGSSHGASPWERSGGGGGANGAAGARGGFTSASYPAGAAGQLLDDALLIPLVGGGGGGGGGSSSGGSGGGGGGAIQIVASGTVTFAASGGVNACGAGGRPGTYSNAGGGGGGGAGGSILVEARAVVVQGTLAANGGGGGGGGQYNTASGTAGGAGPYGATRAAPGSGGGTAGDGGRGGSIAPTPDGESGQDVNPGGGGGGGAGRIRINTLNSSATVSGTVSPDAASGLFSQGQVTTQ